MRCGHEGRFLMTMICGFKIRFFSFNLKAEKRGEIYLYHVKAQSEGIYLFQKGNHPQGHNGQQPDLDLVTLQGCED